MNRLSLRDNWWKFKTAGKLPIILEEFTEYTPPFNKGNQRMSTCKPVGLTKTRISTDYAQKSP
jgi:hypothetical protein